VPSAYGCRLRTRGRPEVSSVTLEIAFRVAGRRVMHVHTLLGVPVEEYLSPLQFCSSVPGDAMACTIAAGGSFSFTTCGSTRRTRGPICGPLAARHTCDLPGSAWPRQADIHHHAARSQHFSPANVTGSSISKHHSREDMITSSASTMMTCPVCQLSGGPFTVDEAALHMATHNRFHHAGAPTAIAVALAYRCDHPAAA
jgi:hypothetical protein